MSAKHRQRFELIQESPQQVRIEFCEDVAYLLKGRRWHPTQTLTAGKNGKVTMMLHAGGCDKIASWVLSWGSHAKVIGSQTLVHAVTKELTTALKQYRYRRQ
jgi:predicted DNA-binding transcriptional regulator YafY